MIGFGLPRAPDFRVDWEALDARHAWIRRMRDVPQDPVWHAEGDVWIHTRMVCEALVALPAWRALSEADRLVLWLAALLHDVAKPTSTRIEDGRVRSPHHSPRGAVDARALLWEAGLDVASREQVCGLVRHHQLPVHALEGEDSERRVSAASLRCRLDHLALLAEADIRGRVCPDADAALTSIALFAEYAAELGCLDGPRVFPSEHTRLLYLQGQRGTLHQVFDDTTCRVTLMVGLPGAGKTTWRQTHRPGWPVVSLDELRSSHGDEGQVRQASRERARELLREHTDFVWDATNLTVSRRRPLLELFRDYGAHVEIVAVEAGPDTLFRQNRERSRQVPEAVIRRMLRRWEMPDPTEAHRVCIE